jgi:hypothetical protein
MKDPLVNLVSRTMTVTSVRFSRRPSCVLALWATVGTLMLCALSGIGHAKGCLKGAAVGGVAGHIAGHHAVAGAAVGCAVGHHRAKKQQKAAEQQQKSAQQTQAKGQQPPAPVQ